ncbi:MAG: tRNA 2-selenouridine synthase [Verrucomicrobiales bacterium]|jgi:tRNA 2-selenouridine synthase
MAGKIQPVSFPLPDEPVFDEIIDVRAPIEFAEDHIAGAVNLPVLFDDQRERIGTQYKQESSFEAQKAGAALVSENIAGHLREHFQSKPKEYRPLIYCFRGGQRSRSLASVLSEIGWSAGIVVGGYKTYRSHVLTMIEKRSQALNFHVINGLTGSGKTVFLWALNSMGAQVLDLEGLANHKGSVFGQDRENPQPSQKRFDSLVFDQLQGFSESRPIFVEAESAKIGRLNLSLPLRARLRESPVSELVSPTSSRVDFLYRDYSSWLTDPQRVMETIDRLQPFHSGETIARWKTWCEEGKWRDLIGELLENHYDERYGCDKEKNYRRPDRQIHLSDQTDAVIQKSAAEFLKGVE